MVPEGHQQRKADRTWKQCRSYLKILKHNRNLVTKTSIKLKKTPKATSKLHTTGLSTGAAVSSPSAQDSDGTNTYMC